MIEFFDNYTNSKNKERRFNLKKLQNTKVEPLTNLTRKLGTSTFSDFKIIQNLKSLYTPQIIDAIRKELHLGLDFYRVKEQKPDNSSAYYILEKKFSTLNSKNATVFINYSNQRFSNIQCDCCDSHYRGFPCCHIVMIIHTYYEDYIFR